MYFLNIYTHLNKISNRIRLKRLEDRSFKRFFIIIIIFKHKFLFKNRIYVLTNTCLFADAIFSTGLQPQCTGTTTTYLDGVHSLLHAVPTVDDYQHLVVHDPHVPVERLFGVQHVLRERLPLVRVHLVDALAHRLAGLQHLLHVLDDHVELLAGHGQHDVGRAVFEQVLVVGQVLPQLLHVGHGVLRALDELFDPLRARQSDDQFTCERNTKTRRGAI